MLLQVTFTMTCKKSQNLFCQQYQDWVLNDLPNYILVWFKVCSNFFLGFLFEIKQYAHRTIEWIQFLLILRICLASKVNSVICYLSLESGKGVKNIVSFTYLIVAQNKNRSDSRLRRQKRNEIQYCLENKKKLFLPVVFINNKKGLWAVLLLLHLLLFLLPEKTLINGSSPLVV